MKREVGAVALCAAMLLVSIAPSVAAGDHLITREQGNPKQSAVSWSYVPQAFSQWKAQIENNGLRSLLIEVYDNSSGAGELVLHQRIRFDAYNAYPTGLVYSDPVLMAMNSEYVITATPNGPRGSYCVVTDWGFTPWNPPVASFAWTATGNSVAFDAALSTDEFGIIAYDWDFGDSTTGSGIFVTHDYVGPGTYQVTLTVTNVIFLTDSMSATVVIPEGTPGKTYIIYDIGAEPWGVWWDKRRPFYWSDFEITDSATDGFSTMFSLTYRDSSAPYRGIVYAPYRMSVDAVAVPELSIDTPEFMPALGPDKEGALATVDIYFQYIHQEWWEAYWLPTWGDEWGWNPDWIIWPNRTAADGWDLGVVYSVMMNRQAAEQWLNMPQTADVAAWWAENKTSYIASWESWITYEGNTRLDIYCGYEWFYDINGGTWMKLTEEPGGMVNLTIGHIALGYEVLMTRWLDEVKLCNHEPYYEDFSLHAAYGSDRASVVTDAVCQYSLHAVKANQTANGMAWVWEPNKIDYIAKAGHHSDFNPYRYLDGDLWKLRMYQSWNAGDVKIGSPAVYEYTPTWFNLSTGDSLVIKLPTSPVFGVVPYPPPTTYAIDQLMSGDPAPMLAFLKQGDMSLGYFVTSWPKESGLDLVPLYDSASKTLTIVGPVSFNNCWHTTTGVLYHGAPWIEFDVTP